MLLLLKLFMSSVACLVLHLFHVLTNAWEKKNLFKVIKEERQLNRDKPGFVRVLVFFAKAESQEKVK